MSKIKDIIDPFLGRFTVPQGRLELLNRIAEKLVPRPGEDLAARENVARALRRLLVDNKFALPDDAVSKDDFQPVFTDMAKDALAQVLVGAGFSGLNPLAAGAIKLINNALDRCGEAPDTVEKPEGPPIAISSSGRGVVVFYLERNPQTKLPLLPAVAGDPRFARTRLILAFEHWQLKLKLDVVETELPDEANLIVTGRNFGPEIDDATLALTDVGPPRGKKVRMVFDLAEVKLTKDEFEATASHEFGHALGVRHRNAAKSGQLMSPMLSTIKEPLEADIAAAVTHGKWQRS